jgi:hypothetical protein
LILNAPLALAVVPLPVPFTSIDEYESVLSFLSVTTPFISAAKDLIEINSRMSSMCFFILIDLLNIFSETKIL